MSKGRLEAFSDGVLAIIITIMVLELKPPHGGDLAALRPLLPSLLGYALSFVYIGIYWNNHHHMLQATPRINGKIMWANLHLLFWLSLVPIVTDWLGENPSASWPTAFYGATLFMAGIAYFLLERLIIAYNGKSSALAMAVGGDKKGLASMVLYALAVGLAFVRPWLSEVVYALVAILWVVPDPRIEKRVASEPRSGAAREG
jgi:uncharacterized membrane protein